MYTNSAFYFALKGRFLVLDGHDFYSQHPRFDYEFAFIKEFGFTSNFMRYAYDLVEVDNENKQYKNTLSTGDIILSGSGNEGKTK